MSPAVIVGDLEAFLGWGGGTLFAGGVWHGFGWDFGRSVGSIVLS